MHLVADSSRCCGCQACLVACSLARFGESNPKKARLAVEPRSPDRVGFEVRTCTQCGHCAEVCPVGAIHRDQRGVYSIDPEECIACMDCVEECPEQVIFVHPDQQAPFMCDLCGQCVAVCVPGVLSISRDE